MWYDIISKKKKRDDPHAQTTTAPLFLPRLSQQM
nr:MAG TPA: Utp21 specific WD40 associated putative domain protein [Caudoviricetes sp.]